MRELYTQQLETMKTRLIQMGAMCEDAISCSVKGMLHGDAELLKKVFLLLFLLEAIALFVRKQKGKPEESKTVRQWALLGRIPIDALKLNYIWETQTDGPVTVYYHEKNTREMTEEEKADFLADQKGYGQRYLQMIIQEKKRLKRA